MCDKNWNYVSVYIYDDERVSLQFGIFGVWFAAVFFSSVVFNANPGAIIRI